MRVLHLLSLSVLLSHTAFYAASSEPVRDRYVEARLVSAHDAVEPGQRVQMGLELTHDAGWHTYWKSSATGYASSLTWDLPEGWEAGDLQWPPPKPYTMGLYVEYVYEDSVILPVTVTVPADAAPGTVTLPVRAEWLMCAEVCIPGKAELSLTLEVAEAARPSAAAGALDAALALLPQAGSVDAMGLRAYRRGERMHLTAAAPELLPESGFHFFDARAVIVPRMQDKVRRMGDDYFLEFQVDPVAPDDVTHLEGVLVQGSGAERQAWSIRVPLQAGPPPKAGAGAAAGESVALGFLLLLAFGGGLILNLMPCVFPILGLKVMHFVQHCGSQRRQVVLQGWIFTLGVLVSFWALSLVLVLLRSGGEELGWGFQLQNPAFIFLLTALLLGLALNMSGVFYIGGSLVGVGSGLTGHSSAAGTFFSGVLATLVATPCSGPLLGTALGAAVTLPALQQWLFFTTMALGFSLPYLLLTTFPRLLAFLPRPGAWMETFKQAMAFLLYASAAYFLWILAGQLTEEQGYTALALLAVLFALVLLGLAAWVWGRYSPPSRPKRLRQGAQLATLVLLALALWVGWPQATLGRAEAGGPAAVVWDNWAPGKPEALVAEGKLVYVDFTARWCGTCQYNKVRVFSSAPVRTFFHEQEVVALKADWTNYDPAITNELARFRRSAVPFNLVYGPGLEAPTPLPELLDPDTVLDALEAAVGDPAAPEVAELAAAAR